LGWGGYKELHCGWSSLPLIRSHAETQDLRIMNALLPESVPSSVGRSAELSTAIAVIPRRAMGVRPRARILYVDAEAQLRLMAKLALVQSGYEVDTAADGAAAWVALNEVSYNLLITDRDMPRVTGLELIIQVRQAGMRLPIVMTSRSLNFTDLAGAVPDLAAFLTKPFAPHLLVETVEQTLRAANHIWHGGEGAISALALLAQSIQPYPHGGINE
jgi:CheY-like chemotaxis protein